MICPGGHTSYTAPPEPPVPGARVEAKCMHCGRQPWQHRTTSILPPVERYVRRTIMLVTGVRLDVGLEHRAGDPSLREVSMALAACAERAAVLLPSGDLQDTCDAFGRMVAAGYPDRYWFIEAWTADDDAAYYQLNQAPAGSKGWRS